jgi:hypothetical protein
MAEMRVGIDGSVSTAAPINIQQGGNTANVAVPGPNLGAGLVVSTGALIASTTLSAVSGTGAGTVADFGSGKQQISLAIATSAGVSAGAVALEVSQDSTNWFRATPVTTNAASTVFQVTQAGAWRYARGNVTTAITGGTVSATLMAA